jgi:hypothetical protein
LATIANVPGACLCAFHGDGFTVNVPSARVESFASPARATP